MRVRPDRIHMDRPVWDYIQLPGWCQISAPPVFEGLPGWWRFSDLIRVAIFFIWDAKSPPSRVALVTRTGSQLWTHILSRASRLVGKKPPRPSERADPDPACVRVSIYSNCYYYGCCGALGSRYVGSTAVCITGFQLRSGILKTVLLICLFFVICRRIF